MIIDWQQIDTVLLDMDGTLLDLHYDNHYWLEHLPKLYAQKKGVSVDSAKQEIESSIATKQGQLEWYCTDYWSEQFGFNIAQTKAEEAVAQRIQFRPNAERFLQLLKSMNKQVWMLTNAHRDVLNIKRSRLNLDAYFDQFISSHDFGFAKEQQEFWHCLQQHSPFDVQRSLFVDDSLPVLESAKQYGIKNLRAVRKPDSQKPEKDIGDFQAFALRNMAV